VIAAGICVYMVQAFVRHEWPFGEPVIPSKETGDAMDRTQIVLSPHHAKKIFRARRIIRASYSACSTAHFQRAPQTPGEKRSKTAKPLPDAIEAIDRATRRHASFFSSPRIPDDEASSLLTYLARGCRRTMSLF